MADTNVNTRRFLRSAFLWWLPILFWELVSIPATSHSNSWRGAWLTLSVVPVSAYFLSRWATMSSVFVYGCSCSLLFVPRFLGMDRFSLWAQYSAPSNHIILLWWLGIAGALGLLSVTAARYRTVSLVTEPKNDSTAFTPRTILVTSVIVFIVLIACIGYLANQRQFLAQWMQWPAVIFTVVRSIASATAIACMAFFLCGNRKAGSTFFTPGGVILLAIAAIAIYRLAATIALVITTHPVTIMTVGDSHAALTTAGLLSASLIVMVHICKQNVWRFPLVLVVATFVFAAFLGQQPSVPSQGLYLILVAVSAFSIAVAAFRDRGVSHIRRIAWVGAATYICITIVSLVPFLTARP